MIAITTFEKAPKKGLFHLFTYICPLNLKNKINMGRGDKKTAKGKRFKGSFGKARPAKSTKKKIGLKKTEA